MHMILAITEGSAMKYFEKGKRAVLGFCTHFCAYSTCFRVILTLSLELKKRDMRHSGRSL